MRARTTVPRLRAERRPGTGRSPGTTRRLTPSDPPTSNGVADAASRLLRRARRSRVVHWGAATLVVLVTISSIRSRQAELDRRIEALGERRPVAVAVRDLPAGARLGTDDVAVRLVPRSLVPDGAVTGIDEDHRLRDAVRNGEILVDDRLADGRASMLAATTPAGTRAVAVPLPPAGLTLREGDRVDLFAVDGSGRSERLVRDAVVVAGTPGAGEASGGDSSADAAPDVGAGIGAASVAVAVPTATVGPVADAVLASTLTVALVGQG